MMRYTQLIGLLSFAALVFCIISFMILAGENNFPILPDTFLPQSSTSMKELWLIRHGQAPHNVLFQQKKNLQAQNLRDPPLNQKGEQQARDLHYRIKSAVKDVELIVTSPLRRTLMTTDIVFSRADIPVLVSPLPREQGDYACDYGSPRSTIQREFPHRDFSGLKERWWTEKETVSQVLERVARFREFLNSRTENTIAVVSHGMFLKHFVSNFSTRRFENCECYRVMLDDEGNVTNSC